MDYRFNEDGSSFDIKEITQPLILLSEGRLLNLGNVMISGNVSEINLFLETLQNNLLKIWNSDFL